MGRRIPPAYAAAPGPMNPGPWPGVPGAYRPPPIGCRSFRHQPGGPWRVTGTGAPAFMRLPLTTPQVRRV